MDLQITIPLLALGVIAVLYALFDLFNNRNVPDVFAYASVVIGLVIAFVFYQGSIVYSLLLALIIGIVGYIIYRLGLWGAGDYFELVAISLMLPLQPTPIFASAIQLGLPFILSVFVAAGFAAIWIVPIYYLLIVRRPWTIKPDVKHMAYGFILLMLYILLFFSVYYLIGFNIASLALMMLIAVPSALTLVFEQEITFRMIERIYPSKLDEGDIIAFNMMSKKETRYFSKYSDFGRLATKELIAKMRKAKMKLPVYRNAAPLAFFILIGVVISLLFGNIVLFVV